MPDPNRHKIQAACTNFAYITQFRGNCLTC